MPPSTLLRRAAQPKGPRGFHASRVIEFRAGFEPPSIIEFCLSDAYLNRPNLYPRQATLLKIMFLQKDMLTQYDYDVIGEWTESYLHTADERGEGNNGIVPDVLERMDLLIAQGRPWFRQTSNISGRRGSKGHIGGQAGAYVLWNYMGLADPQDHFGIDRDKALTGIVFAGKKDQAIKNQWGDLNSVILGGPCFTPYIAKALGESLSVYSPNDWLRKKEREERGIVAAGDMATFQIVPKESTLMAGRGPASFMQFYDEMAHVVATGANRSAEEIYTAATPALDQFGNWGFIYIPTSPWQKIGQAYVEYQQSIETHEGPHGTQVPSYPEKLMVQLTSWDIYKDWEIAHQIPREPGDFTFRRLKTAIQAYDDNMRSLERANPETFRVERRCLDPETRVLCSDLMWRRIDDLQPGDELVGLDEEGEVQESGRRGERRMRTSVVEAKADSWDSAYRIEFTDGSSVVCSGNHRWLSGSQGTTSSLRWRTIDPQSKVGPRTVMRSGDVIRHIVVDPELGTEVGGGFKTVHRIVPLGEQRLVDIQTSTGTFIAEGLVSHNSQWATAMNAYLNPDRVKDFFKPYPDEAHPLTQRGSGLLSETYRAHGDPSKSGAGFGFAMAHIAGYDDQGLPHVVFDRISAWNPSDFENNEIDYNVVETDLEGVIKDFMPTEMTFDQFNCLDGDTLLFTEDGLCTIRGVAGDLDVGQVRNIDLGIQSREGASRARQIYRRGPTQVRRLTTKLGSEVSVTPEHRMWVRKAKARAWHPENSWGWLTADQIEVGDWLCIRRDNLLATTEVDLTDLHPARDWRWDHALSRLSRYPKACDEDLGFLLGSMVAEGKCVSGLHCSFSNTNRDYMQAVEGAWSHTFGGEWKARWTPATDRWSEFGTISGGANVSGFLHSLGCSGLSQAKQVPWVIMKSPRPVVAAFLRGLFEGDGGVQVHDHAGEWVHFTSTSRTLAHQTQQLLLGLGVFSTLWPGHYTYQGEVRDQYRVKISGPDLLDYQRQVGFVSTHKMGLLDEAVALVIAKGTKAGLRSKHRRVGDEYWVRVTSIQEGVADCYDISVPGPECFLANGIVSHNSVGTIQRLQKYALRSQLPKRVTVYERTATGPLNWKTYETFKTALNMGLLHGPYFELAELELTFLQDLGGKVEHPTSGPVQTKDVADCYHSCMEVLTEQGWMLIKDVPRGIKVATRSPEGLLEYQEPTDYIARHHKGVMYEYDSNRLNFSVTPGHRMLVSNQHGEQFIAAEDLTSKRYNIPKTAVVEERSSNRISFDTEDTTAALRRVVGRGGARNEAGWTQEQDDYLREHYATTSMADLCAVLGKTRGAVYNRAKPKHLDLKRGQIGDRIGDRPAPLPETKVEDFAAFLGIWLAEGRKMRDKPGYDVKITQTKPDAVEWIDSLFARLPWPVKRTVQKNGETVWVVKSQGLREYLRACQGEGHELMIPDEVFATWTHREMEQLLEGLLVGDGCWDSKVQRHTGYYSTSKRLVDDVQRLLMHLGCSTGAAKIIQRTSQYRANHDLWYVGVNTSQYATLHTERLKQVEYDDMVYCLTVPNSTLLVRRNGVPMWAGNCIAIVTYELIGAQMSAFIGRSLGEVKLQGMAQGGMNPYPEQAEQAHEALSGFGRRSGAPGGGSFNPARGGVARGMRRGRS